MTTPVWTVCQGVRSDGYPCKAMHALSPGGLCVQHDPERRANIDAKRKHRGGRNKKAMYAKQEDLPCGGLLETIEHCEKWSAWLAIQTVLGLLDQGAAREANKAVFTLKNTLEKRLGADKRLKQLEKLLAERGPGSR